MLCVKCQLPFATPCIDHIKFQFNVFLCREYLSKCGEHNDLLYACNILKKV